jgi:hypothetical protein
VLGEPISRDLASAARIGSATNRHDGRRTTTSRFRSITKMPGPAPTYFDNVRELHRVLGRRTFPGFRRET